MRILRVLPVLPLLLLMAACSDGNTAVQQSSAVAAESMQDTTTYIPRVRDTSTFPTPSGFIDMNVDTSGGGVRATLPVTELDTVPPGAIMDLR